MLVAVISLFAIFGVLARYSWDPIVNLVKRRRQGTNEHHSRAFFHTQLGAYIASLMLCNALSSISMIINVQWAADKRVTEGAHLLSSEGEYFCLHCSLTGMLCNTQGTLSCEIFALKCQRYIVVNVITLTCVPGILMQIGDTGGAYFTGAIAIHTFNTLVLRNKLPGWTCLAASIWGWLVAVLLGQSARLPQPLHAAHESTVTAATPTWINNSVLGPIYGINGLSCGIAIRWSLLNMVLHLLPVSLLKGHTTCPIFILAIDSARFAGFGRHVHAGLPRTAGNDHDAERYQVQPQPSTSVEHV